MLTLKWFIILIGQFGTGVVSYFVFLRWLIFLNFVMFVLYFLLIIIPFAAFPLLPHKNVKAPNETLFTEEYLEQFPKYKNIPYSKKVSIVHIFFKVKSIFIYCNKYKHIYAFLYIYFNEINNLQYCCHV